MTWKATSGDSAEVSESLLRWAVFVQGLSQPLSDLLSGLVESFSGPAGFAPPASSLVALRRNWIWAA